MYFKNVKIVIFVLIFLLLNNCAKQIQCRQELNPSKSSTLYKMLSDLNCSITKIESDSSFIEKYEIMMKQPLDHNNPDIGTFKQRIIISHLDFDLPVVFLTEGYSAGTNYLEELCELLHTNQIRVEHRYFGESKPDSMIWKYLNIEQAAKDHHKIVEIFKKFYKGKWINTGWSKGGQTAILHRYFFPNDVDATIAYVAPLNFALEDPRIDDFFDNVGTKQQRQKLIDFQRLALKKKNEVLPLFKWYCKGKGYTYSIGLEKAYEYIILEYSFSFWQYSDAIFDSIPEKDADINQILEHLKEIVSFSSYADRSMNSVSMYQFSTQLGYYGYVTKNVQDLLSQNSYPNYDYAPTSIAWNYDPVPMKKLDVWLKNKGNNIIYIYGGNDPWTGSAIIPTSKTNAIKMIKNNGNHFTFIKSFSDKEQKMILKTLNNWLK